MKRVSQRGMYNAVADINIVPMLDLVFNLLIIFMLTTPLLEQSIPINLPTARNAAPIKEQDLTTVNLNATGGIFLDRKPVTLAELESAAAARVKINPDHAVVVRGDEKVPYGKFVEIVDQLKKAGVTKLGIVGMTGKK